jgi:hypothetical protein
MPILKQAATSVRYCEIPESAVREPQFWACGFCVACTLRASCRPSTFSDTRSGHNTHIAADLEHVYAHCRVSTCYFLLLLAMILQV